MSSDPVATIEDAEAALYRGPIESFVADRNALVKAVRAGGDRELATDIKSLRKPTVAADALNKTIQANPAGVEALLAAVAALRTAQEAALGGDRSEFAARQAEYRDALDELGAGAGPHRVEVTAALEALAIDGREEELRAATFSAPPKPSGGFGLPLIDSGPAEPRARRPATKPAKKTTPQPAVRKDVARRRAAARKLATAAVAAAEAELAEAEDELTAATEAAEELAAGIVDLEAQLEKAKRGHTEAAKRLAAVDARRVRVAGKVEAARVALDRSDG